MARPTAEAAMTCSVCGSESNADARFCARCGARLHPEEDTLSRHSRATPVVTAQAPSVSALQAPNAAAAQRTPRAAGWLLLAVALIAVGYVAYRQLLPGAPSADVAATSPATPGAPAGAAPAPQSPEPKSEPSAPTVTAPATTAAPPLPMATAPAPAAPRPLPRPRPAKPAPAAPSAQPVAVAPPPPSAPAAVVTEAPKPDRFQQLSDALGRCKGRDLIGKAVCEQRARLQYCDGYWDQIPQCSGVGKLNPAAN